MPSWNVIVYCIFWTWDYIKIRTLFEWGLYSSVYCIKISNYFLGLYLNRDSIQVGILLATLRYFKFIVIILPDYVVILNFRMVLCSTTPHCALSFPRVLRTFETINIYLSTFNRHLESHDELWKIMEKILRPKVKSWINLENFT